MNVAYLINRYPHISHTFIRREINAVETLGIDVLRVSIRGATNVVDPADVAEVAKTRVLLSGSIIILLFKAIYACLYVFVTRPFRIWHAAATALKLGAASATSLFKHCVYLAEACMLSRWLLSKDVTHIHAHFGTNPAAVALLCHEITGIPYSFTVHGPEEFDAPQTLRLEEKIDRAKFVVAVSSFGRSQLYRWCSYASWSKVHVVRCTVDSSFAFELNRPLQKTARFVCVGRLCEQKGQLLLIDALDLLYEQGLSCQVVFVGDGPMRQQLEQQISKRHLGESCSVTGWCSSEQIRDHILASEALVLPSFAEGLPVVLMEAMALHRTVISTFIAGIPELVFHENNGWLIPAGDVVSLAQAMRSVIECPPERLSVMGAAAAAVVSRAHNPLKEASKLVGLFQSPK